MQILSLSLIGGLLVLDTTAALQILISQPLIACTILGWFGGNVQLGLHFGLLIQLLWLSQLPVGAAKIPAGNLGSIAGVILALQLSPIFPEYEKMIILAAVICALLFSYLGAILQAKINNWNTFFFNSVLKFLEQGRAGALGVINVLALVFRFMLVAILLYGGVQVSFFLVKESFLVIPLEWDAYARYVEIAVVGAGIGSSLELYRGRKKMLTLLSGFSLGLLLFFF